MEVELESEVPTKMGGDMSASMDEGDKGTIVASVERHEPATTSIGSRHDTEMRGDVPKSRKHAMSEDIAIEQEAKRS